TPNDPELLKNMAELRSRMQDMPGATDLYRAAVRHNACLLSASLGLGAVLQAQGRETEATEVLRRAAACPSSSSYMAYQVGLALEQQGLKRDALQIWEDVLKQTHNAPVNEQAIRNTIQQRAAQLRVQLTAQNPGVNAVPISSGIQSSVLPSEAH
ncbi:MAG TPA: hypothetical protein VIJ87_01470, partial [Pyrinomonadaceae bacterium]